MVSETNQNEKHSSEEAEAQQAPAKKPRFAIFRGRSAQYWLVIFLIVTLAVHGLGLAYYKFSSASTPVVYSPEITVGNFRFAADKSSGGLVKNAEFALYITALDGLDRLTRNRLASHQYRVQQGIETLLRQAHSGDFDDPALNDLKRQIREEVNKVLDGRVVSDVIITNLKITLSDKTKSNGSTETAASPPWLDMTSSYIGQ
jgi:flagellar basal body-associated protein FliL